MHLMRCCGETQKLGNEYCKELLSTGSKEVKQYITFSKNTDDVTSALSRISTGCTQTPLQARQLLRSTQLLSFPPAKEAIWSDKRKKPE